MKKISSFCAVLLAAVIAFSCLVLPASASGVQIVKKPDQTTFYQGVDWMYSKDGDILLMKGGINLSGTSLKFNGKTVEYKTGTTGPNMYARSASGKWQAGKNQIRIYCDSFDSNYAVFEVMFSSVKSISIVRTPKTKLIVGTEWNLGINKDVEMTKYDLTGTIINATYEDSTVKEISAPNACLGWSIPDNTDVVMPGNNTLYITFCGKKAPFSVTFITEKNFARGDVSLDGKVSSYDALNVLQYATGSITLSPSQIALGDVDGNSKLNSVDALRILQYVVGIRKSL